MEKGLNIVKFPADERCNSAREFFNTLSADAESFSGATGIIVAAVDEQSNIILFHAMHASVERIVYLCERVKREILSGEI